MFSRRYCWKTDILLLSPPLLLKIHDKIELLQSALRVLYIISYPINISSCRQKMANSFRKLLSRIDAQEGNCYKVYQYWSFQILERVQGNDVSFIIISNIHCATKVIDRVFVLNIQRVTRGSTYFFIEGVFYNWT